MSDKYAELRRLAEAATPGPWESVKRSEYDGSDYFLIQSQEERNGWEIAEIRMDVPHENAAFIAAANPSTILSIIDELEACMADLAQANGQLDLAGDALERGCNDEALLHCRAMPRHRTPEYHIAAMQEQKT